jgi:hypothetical protein
MAKTRRTIRDLRIAARAGDHSAAKALLRRAHKDELIFEIHRGKPFTPRVRSWINCLTAGTGETDEPRPPWEYRNEHGEIENLLLPDMPSPDRFKDDDP